MFKAVVVLLVVGALLMLPFQNTVFAQSGVAVASTTVGQEVNGGDARDIKDTIAEKDREVRENSTSVNVKELAKIDRERSRGGSRFTGKQKAYIALAILGVAALVFVAIKYGKECKTYEPAGCSSSDDNCRCTEYYQNL